VTLSRRGSTGCLLAASVWILAVGPPLASGTAAAQTTTQQETIERLGRATLAFIDRSDRAANAGAEGRERAALRREFDGIQRPLDDIYQTNRDALERMAKRVMDEDGDLEALYETPEFKRAQSLASQSLYYLNWLDYYGARLYDGARRKELLEAARSGFSEFAVGDRRTELLVESLLGRGLCNLELGNTEYAVHDLRSVMDDAHASPERRAKARLALLDAYVRGGNLSDALRLSTQLLGSGSRADDNVIRFLRIRALLDGAKKASPADAGRYRQEALAQMDQLRRAGGGWSEKVTALLITSVDNPEQWASRVDSPFAKWELAKIFVQKGDYKQAAPLLESVVASTDSALAAHQSQAHYFLAVAQLQAKQYQAAANNFTAALQRADESYAADAAYLRFKALEALVAQGAPPEIAGLYEAAMTEYLDRFPTHKSAFEARFRLGELRQAQRRFPEAIEAYALVRGDPAFELRAAFGTLQCRFEQLEALDGNVAGEQRTALLAPIGPALTAFDEHAAAYTPSGAPTGDGVPLPQMRAKAAVMRAVYVTLQPDPQAQAVLDALADFEAKYPDQADLLPQVTKLRMNAYLRLDRFTDAEAEVDRHGPQLLAAVGPKGVDDLAVGFVREGARRRPTDGADANVAAQRTALRLYELVPAEDSNAKGTLTKARLYETTGEPQKAAALYETVLGENPQSLAALRGLGRIAEAEGRLPAALGYWQQIVAAARPGDAPWYEGRYEVARLTQATGKPRDACTQLQELKPAMPGLGDPELRKKLDALYREVCA
jgi:tetratricopeptide (TPR) repeat protein